MNPASTKLYAFALSPFVHKVAAILDFKKIPYETVFVHPQKKTEIEFSRRKLVPILDDAGEVVEDSTDIALYLEGKYPDPPILPEARKARSAALEIERWLDDTFYGRYYVATLFGIPANRERVIKALFDTTNFSGFEKWFLPRAAAVILRHTIADAQSNLVRTGEMLDELEARIGSGPYLGELSAPSLADFAAFGPLSVITDLNLEGAEQLRDRPTILEWMERVRPQTSPGTRIYGG